MQMEEAHDRKKWKTLKEAYILQWYPSTAEEEDGREDKCRLI